jgi:hypothetical protein
MNPVNTLEGFAARLRELMPSALDFNQLSLELFALQYQRNPTYRKTCEKLEISPGTIEHWSKIPAVPAAAFKEFEVSCIPANERTAVFYSSGTTEQTPSRHFHHDKSLQIYEASLLHWFGVHLLNSAQPPGSAGVAPASRGAMNSRPRRRDTGASGPLTRNPPFPPRSLALTPPLVQAPHSSLVHMFDTLRRALNFTQFTFTGQTADDGAWELDCRASIEFLGAAIEANEPVVILGTAFSFVHLLDFMAGGSLSLRLPEGSQVLETGGYKGRSRVLPKSELHSLIRNLLGVPASHIVCEYGMSELNSQAYDCVVGPDKGLVEDEFAAGRGSQMSRCFQFPPWVRIQIISPETGREVSEGETGLLQVFDLANVYSVMAIQTEDLAVRRGDGFELVGRAAMAEQRGCSLMARQA